MTFAVLVLLLFSIYWPHPPLHISYCWDIVRAICYQELHLVTCWVNSWWRLFSTRGFSSLWLTRNGIPIFTYYWFHIPVTLYITSFNLFHYFTVYGWNVNWMKWNKCWMVLFWFSLCRACWNFLDSGFCAFCVVLQREYKFFTVLLDLHKVFNNLWIPDGSTFW